MINSEDKIKKYGDFINLSIQKMDLKKLSIDENLAKSMHYSLKAGGKRLRPILVMAVIDMFYKQGKDFLNTALAIECIHTYSLIHDDLPAMDNDDLRRGKPTNHIVFGEAVAILAGDALLTYAFQLLANENIDSDKKIKIINLFSKAAGANGMVGGQGIDIIDEKKDFTIEDLRFMHNAKTGALFEAAILAGAIIGDATTEEYEVLKIYAKEFGLAFQITDDILDVVGKEEEIGKPVGSDEKNHKITYVTLTNLTAAKELAQNSINKGISSLDIFGSRSDFLKELLIKLQNRIS